jgi:valyl-tRNA synthetase
LHQFNEAAKAANDGLEAREFHKSTNAIYVYWLYQLCDVYIVCPSTMIYLMIGKLETFDARRDARPEEVRSRYYRILLLLT